MIDYELLHAVFSIVSGLVNIIVASWFGYQILVKNAIPSLVYMELQPDESGVLHIKPWIIQTGIKMRITNDQIELIQKPKQTQEETQ